MVGDTFPKLAVLIDADNAQPLRISQLLAEVTKYGTAHVKRAYGDWTSPCLGGWKNELLKQSIQPIQQFAYTHGKNATDSAMIIDAMDLLYSGRLDAFCLVSSDSDFTRLAARIRESGLIVYGFGETKTPKPFVAACDKFIYTENLVHIDALVPHATAKVVSQSNGKAHQARESDELENKLRTTVERASDDNGWAKLSVIGSLLIKQYPDFDSRTYGYHKLSDLITDLSSFEIDHRSRRTDLPKEIWVRDKRRERKSVAGEVKT
ncbi:NYN domain-containing protein [Aspergillus bertholletiae]|uniref:NYN domain-containing protein n=1 Tax=Aspergillus bertholletiae TaxID=1226010 RepID=A0A5N7B1Z8_9EURO|nr:NYN domain-containing protein [Aspergillus bertholletiae]